MTKRESVVLAIAAAIGLAVWVGIVVATGKSEAWDSHLYFVVGLPIMLITSGIAGYLEPERFRLWGVAVVCLQPIAGFFIAGLGPFLLVGIVTFGLITGICLLSAWAGSGLRRRRKG